jgi:hypothetical protein
MCKIFAAQEQAIRNTVQTRGRERLKENTMRLSLICAAALSAALAQPAWAGSAANSEPNTSGSAAESHSTSSATESQSATSLPQELRSKLKGAGFSNIEIVPHSFFVQARDKNNNPVQMVITPNAMMAVTQVQPNSSATTGSGNNSSSNSNSTQQPPSSQSPMSK